MSLRRSLFLLALLPVALPVYAVASRLGFLSYAVRPDKLPRNSFARLTTAFVQCPDCGHDGLLVVSGRVMAHVVTHQQAVNMLADWAHTFNGSQYANLYNQVANATWLPGYLPMLPIPRLDPTYAQVDVAVKAHLMLLQAIRWGRLSRAIYA